MTRRLVWRLTAIVAGVSLAASTAFADDPKNGAAGAAGGKAGSAGNGSNAAKPSPGADPKPGGAKTPEKKPPQPAAKAPPVPKITAVSPSALVYDDTVTSIDVELTGTDFPVSDTQVTFDSDPPEYLHVVKKSDMTLTSPTMIRVRLQADTHAHLMQLLPPDVSQKFRVTGSVKTEKPATTPKATGDNGEGWKPVVSEVSGASFTPHLPLFARKLCRIHTPGSDTQIRLQVPLVPNDVRVFVVENDAGHNPRDKVPCSTLQVFGVDEVVCYVPELTVLGPSTRVQVLRSGEHEAPAPYNESVLGNRLDMKTGAACTDLWPELAPPPPPPPPPVCGGAAGPMPVTP